MNHFLLPGEQDGRLGRANDYLGVHLMELLINGLLREGADKDRLVAKIFGGRAQSRDCPTLVAQRRIRPRFLEREGIKLLRAALVVSRVDGSSFRRQLDGFVRAS